MVNKEIKLQSLISQAKVLIDKHNTIQKNVGGLFNIFSKAVGAISQEILEIAESFSKSEKLNKLVE